MHRKLAQRCAVLSLIALPFAGCRDTTAPTARSRAEDATPALARQKTRKLKAAVVTRLTPLDVDESTTITVTPQGGTAILANSGTVVWFPEGAVSSDLVVTVTAIHGSQVVYNFEPHGTVFNKPIYVAQLLRFTALDRRGSAQPKLWGGYLSGGVSSLTLDGSGLFAEIFDATYAGEGSDSYGVFTTTHFSGYALASGKVQQVVDDVVDR